MDKSDYEEFSGIWFEACEAATGKGPSVGALDFIFNCLIDVTLPEICAGLIAHTNNPDTCGFWPQAGSIRRFLAGNGDLVSQKAWQKVEHANRCVNYHDDLWFEDPIIMQTIHDMGGRVILLNSTTENICYTETTFKKVYRAHTQTGIPLDPPAVFRGSKNIDRINKGKKPLMQPSYEETLAEGIKRDREGIKTQGRPRDKLIDDAAKRLTVNPDQVLGNMLALTNSVKTGNEETT